jgi:tripartite-type tricarboxylate transporter receptor subunit TctC
MFLKKFVLGFLLCLISFSTFSNDYPSKSIKLIVAFTPGGTTDILARQLAIHLEKETNQNVIIEYKPGGGGNIGIQHVVNSPADGYTLLIQSLGGISINPTLYENLSFNAQEDLIPISLLAQVPLVFVVPPTMPVNSMKDFINLSRKNKGKFNYGSTGIGTGPHLTGFLFNQTAGIEAEHIPYKGAEGLIDLSNGRIEYSFSTLPAAIQYIRAGKLKALAVSTKNRSPSLPDVPTLRETGVNMTVTSWFGVFAPKNTDPKIVEYLNKEINKSIKKSEEAYNNAGAEIDLMSSREFQKFVRDEFKMWAPVVRKSGAKP